MAKWVLKFIFQMEEVLISPMKEYSKALLNLDMNSNLSFGLSSSDSREFTQQILGISAEVNGQRPFARLKGARGASKLPEGEGVKPKTQVNI